MLTNQKSLFAPADRTHQVAVTLWVTLALNWSTALLKILFGLATRCMVITADGLHSFSDGASNIIGLVGISISGHPADRDHPYGHQKYETLASVAIALMLFLVSFGIARQAVGAFIHPRTPQVNAASFVVMGLTFLVNVFVVWYERRRGKVLSSELLLSDSWHTLSDIFVTISVVVALVGIHLDVPRVDSIFSLVIAGVIFVIALGILKRGSDVLCDKAVLGAEEIERIVRGVKGVLDCHEIRTRGKSDSIYVDLHVLVDPQMSVLESHRLANIIEYDIRKAIPGVRDVVVHIEPVSHEHEELEKI